MKSQSDIKVKTTFGNAMINDSDADHAVQLYKTYKEAKVMEVERNKELSHILIFSGFQFDGYKIVRYSGYISGDDTAIIKRENLTDFYNPEIICRCSIQMFGKNRCFAANGERTRLGLLL